MSDNTKIRICRTTLTFLKYSLLWPNEKHELNADKWFYIRVGSFLLITSGWALAVISHLIVSLKMKETALMIEDVSLIVAFCGVYYMTVIYVKNQPKIAFFLRDLSDFDEFGQPPGFHELNKRLGFWSKVVHYYALSGVFTYNAVQLYQKPDCERTNKLKGLNENCGLLSPTWFPFEIDSITKFCIVLIYVLFSCQMLMKQGIVISYTATEIAHHIILRIDHLNTMVKECFNIEDYNVSKTNLKQCILYHKSILSFVTRLNDCFSNAMFAHLTITAAICGCLEKQFMDGINRLGAFSHVTGWILALFIACYGGQQLINATDFIPNAIWSSNWYRQDLRLQKDILFMLMRSQKGLYITVGSFGVLSFALFLSVLKMSYSILAMLTS